MRDINPAVLQVLNDALDASHLVVNVENAHDWFLSAGYLWHEKDQASAWSWRGACAVVVVVAFRDLEVLIPPRLHPDRRFGSTPVRHWPTVLAAPGSVLTA